MSQKAPNELLKKASCQRRPKKKKNMSTNEATRYAASSLCTLESPCLFIYVPHSEISAFAMF